MLKRVDSISESPGSVRQLNESRFGRNNTCKPILELHLAKGTTLEICSNLCELEALLTRYNNKNKMTSIIRGIAALEKRGWMKENPREPFPESITASMTNHERRKDFFQGGQLVNFSKNFSGGGQRW